jgi:hypothetical protein
MSDDATLAIIVYFVITQVDSCFRANFLAAYNFLESQVTQPVLKQFFKYHRNLIEPNKYLLVYLPLLRKCLAHASDTNLNLFLVQDQKIISAVISILQQHHHFQSNDIYTPFTGMPWPFFIGAFNIGNSPLQPTLLANLTSLWEHYDCILSTSTTAVFDPRIFLPMAKKIGIS